MIEVTTNKWHLKTSKDGAIIIDRSTNHEVYLPYHKETEFGKIVASSEASFDVIVKAWFQRAIDNRGESS